MRAACRRPIGGGMPTHCHTELMRDTMPGTLRLLPLICPLLLSATQVSAAEPPAATIDFLSTASSFREGTLWKVFLEDPHLAVSDVWSLDDGVLVCKGMPKGYVYTAKDYRDFVLKLQWRWSWLPW